MYKNFIKSILDFTLALFGILITSPIVSIIALFLTIANKGNPFFLQKRPGKNGKLFTIIKFKTMNDKKDRKGNFLSDEQRITKIGTVVRKLSLDEIPQLINVLKGDMSLIGPRPLLPEYVPLYNETQKRRHEVKPGITGWAQVNGRNAISWEQKFDYDVWYVDNLSFLLDLKIVFLTIKKVLKQEGISAKNTATIECFQGSKVRLIGAGGHAKVVLDCIEQEAKFEIVEIIDDVIEGFFVNQLEVKKRDKNQDYNTTNTIIAIGNPKHRKNIAEQLKSNFIMTIHPTAVVSKYAKIGKGTQVLATAVINAAATIGNHCIVNTGAIVEHDCVLEDYVHIAPNATLGGGVKVGESTQIGIGATIIQNISIGKNVVIGAGAVVVNNIPDNCTAVGVPARPIMFHD